jgi:drug/metabolite transporter (DMT)-like permease
MKFKPNPYLEVILAAIIWSSTGLFVKNINLPTTTITFFRLFVPSLILSIYFIYKKFELNGLKNKIILLASLLNAIRLLFYFIGFEFTTMSNAVIILYTWPIFATILSRIILNEKIIKRNIFLLVISFIGIIFIYIDKEINFESNSFIGMSSMLLSALIYSSTVILFKKESHKYSNFETVYYQNFIGSILFIPFIFINRPFPSVFETTIITSYALLIGILGFGLFFSALKRIKASTASFLAYFEVLSGILFGIIVFKDSISWNMLVGGFIIITSTIFLKK